MDELARHVRDIDVYHTTEDKAAYNTLFREFILPYDEVRQAQSPDAMLLEFLQDTYEAAANLGKWDRSALERTEFPSRTALPARSSIAFP